MRKITAHKPKIEMGDYIDPLSDFGFKRLFGSEPVKELLIDFLNELFQGRKVVKDLTYDDNEKQGPLAGSRKAIFDLTCTGAEGEQFIIEVQRIRQGYFKDRAIYYSSRLIHDQVPQGKLWDYSLKEVYFIGLMDFFLEDSIPGEYLQRVHLAYENSGKVFYKKLEWIFIEIPKFVKSEQELRTGIDKWVFVLKNMSRLEKIPAILNSRIFTKLFNIASVSNLSKKDFMKYEKDMMAIWDEYAIKKTLLEEGREEGRQLGIKEGIEEGIKEGREEGRKEGKAQVVKNLILKMAMTDSQAADIAEVSVAFVRKIRQDLKK